MANKGRITFSANKENLRKFKEMCGLTPYSRILDKIIENTISIGNIHENSVLMHIPTDAMNKMRTMCREQGKTISEVIVGLLEDTNATT